jgi:hypothetical protein
MAREMTRRSVRPACVPVSLALAALLAIGVGHPALAQVPDPAEVSLEIEIRREPGAPIVTYGLVCNPPGGTVLDPHAACQRIAALLTSSSSEPRQRITVHPDGSISGSGTGQAARDTVCAAIYGGPEVARIRGWWLGGPVDATLTRVDGCAISGYDATMTLLGVP